jgi:ferric-dicitrate binding protein FerR (iron transport regulator)
VIEDLDLLARYVSGRCSLAEQRQVREWLDESPENAAELERWRAIWEGAALLRAEPLPAPIDTQSALDRLKEQLTRPVRALAPRVISIVPRRSANAGTTHIVWYRAIPFAIGVAAAGLAMLLVTQVRARGRETGAWHEYATRAGEREKVTLADGTQFILAPASSLRVPRDYAAGDRSVIVDGEVFFAVVHDPAHPFVVHAGNAVTTDVGTAFDVRSYAGDPAVRLAVVEGAVAVAPDGPDTRGSRCPASTRQPAAPCAAPVGAPAIAGDLAIVTPDRRVVIRHGADVASATAWTAGTLVFRDAPLPEVAAELSRWYGVSIVLADETLRMRHVTAVIDQRSVTTVLDVLAPGVGARYDVRDRLTYTLHANPGVRTDSARPRSLP